MLNRHLVRIGLSSQEEAGMHDELDKAFMSIWADNGDASAFLSYPCGSQR